MKTLDSEPHFSARNDTCDVPSSVGSGSNEQPIRWLGISREWPPLPLFQQIFSWRAAIQDTLGRGRARRESDLGRECHARRFHAERLRQCAGRPQAARAIHPRRSRRIRAAPHPGNLLDGRATTRRDAPRLRGAEGRSTRRCAPDARVIRRWLRLGQHAGARLPSRAPGCARPRPPDTMTTQPCASSPENPRTHR